MLVVAGEGAVALVVPLLVLAGLAGVAVLERWSPASVGAASRRRLRRVRSRSARLGRRAGSRLKALARPRRARSADDGLRHELRELHRAAAEHRRAGRVEAALVCSEHAVAMAAATGDRRDEAVTLNGLGLALVQADQPQRAEDCFRRAAAILRELGDRPLAAHVLRNLIALYERQGRLDEAALLSEGLRTLA